MIIIRWVKVILLYYYVSLFKVLIYNYDIIKNIFYFRYGKLFNKQ